LITKDLEFADSFFLRRDPARLLLVLTGNISNEELEGLFQANLARIVGAFDFGALVEFDRYGLTIRA
jgi:predicted nuclease of predicted toxin-antitoxin system